MAKISRDRLRRTRRVYGQKLFLELPDELMFYRRIHRFHTDPFESVCPVLQGAAPDRNRANRSGDINAKIDPKNAEEANKQKFRHIKRAAMWLDALQQDGRKITALLAVVGSVTRSVPRQVRCEPVIASGECAAWEILQNFQNGSPLDFADCYTRLDGTGKSAVIHLLIDLAMGRTGLVELN